MEYNTSRNKLVIPEYGRNVQKMIEYVCTVEDREKRTRMASTVVQIMGQIHPQHKDLGDLKQKLWDHIHIISNFELDVDGPYPPPSKEVLKRKPQSVPYSKGDITYKHYGKNIEKIIKELIEFEEGQEKEAMIKNIANQLKKLYLTWNRDSVNDELIVEHLKELSDGKLKLNEDVTLNHTNEILAMSKKKKYPKQGGYTGHKGKKKK